MAVCVCERERATEKLRKKEPHVEPWNGKPETGRKARKLVTTERAGRLPCEVRGRGSCVF